MPLPTNEAIGNAPTPMMLVAVQLKQRSFAQRRLSANRLHAELVGPENLYRISHAGDTDQIRRVTGGQKELSMLFMLTRICQWVAVHSANQNPSDLGALPNLVSRSLDHISALGEKEDAICAGHGHRRVLLDDEKCHPELSNPHDLTPHTFGVQG
jgi:hypothetical protein